MEKEKKFSMPPNKRKRLDDVIRRRFFLTPSFEIYSGVKGLYDFGPSGCAVKTNLEQYWREHFILEEDM
jgi:glycyl-tRNA synthetase